MKCICLAIILWALAFVAYAQDYEKGAEAYSRSDFAEALRQWRPLAEKGDDGAQTSLGIMYVFGYGVELDYLEAAKWFREAAFQGNEVAQYNFGIMYELGAGVPQDNVRAFMWISVAARAGNPEANEALQFMLEIYSSSEIEHAKVRIDDWSPGSDDLEWERGLAAIEADDMVTALQAWLPLAEKGGPIMQTNVANALDAAGKSEMAYELWAKAAESGERRAQYGIGNLYAFGRAVEQSYSQAARWWRKAAAQCHVPAQYNLGLLYYRGQGVERDLVEGYRWLTRAASGYQKIVDDGFELTRHRDDALKMGKKAYRKMNASQKVQAEQFEDELCAD
jgi:uncharacterized protein